MVEGSGGIVVTLASMDSVNNSDQVGPICLGEEGLAVCSIKGGIDSLDGPEAIRVYMERGSDGNRVDGLEDGGHLSDGVIGVRHSPGVANRGEFLCFV